MVQSIVITVRHCFSRQACAEEIKIEEDGSIKQVEVTSCGLNGGPLKGQGEYEARIACNLSSDKGERFHKKPFGKDSKDNHPYFTQSGADREGGRGSVYRKLYRLRNGGV